MMNKECDLTYTMAFWLLRIWLAVRCIFTGLVKFQGTEEIVKNVGGLSGNEAAELAALEASMASAGGPPSEKVTETINVLGFSHYEALPAKGPMSIEGFKSSPFMPDFMVEPYATVLGYALVILGVMLLLGICTRVTLFLQGLLFISLTFGFVILEKSLGQASAAGAAYLGVHILIVALALLLSKYNKFELLPCGKLPICKCK